MCNLWLNRTSANIEVSSWLETIKISEYLCVKWKCWLEDLISRILELNFLQTSLKLAAIVY